MGRYVRQCMPNVSRRKFIVENGFEKVSERGFVAHRSLMSLSYVRFLRKTWKSGLREGWFLAYCNSDVDEAHSGESTWWGTDFLGLDRKTRKAQRNLTYFAFKLIFSPVIIDEKI